jgi:two-component system cell cycle sensor histidine kinase/response regulator CckA
MTMALTTDWLNTRAEVARLGLLDVPSGPLLAAACARLVTAGQLELCLAAKVDGEALRAWSCEGAGSASARLELERGQLPAAALQALKERRVVVLPGTVALPLERKGRAVGVLVASRAELEVDLEAQEGLREVAFDLGAALGRIRTVERTQVEAELEDERTRLRGLLNTIPDLVWLKDPDGRYLACNLRFESLTGVKEADLVGRTDYDFFPRQLADFFRENDRKAVAAGRPLMNDEWLTFVDGHRELVQTTKTAMYTDDRRLVGVLGIARDMTAARQAETALAEMREHLMHAQKMEAVGVLAGGVAHDFNNLLTVISGFTRLVLDDDGLDARSRARLDQVERSSERAAGLTQQLLAFSRKLPSKPRCLPLGPAVLELESMLRRLIGEHLALQVVVSPDAGDVLVDPGQLEQVVMNLVVNARDASSTGGVIRLEVAPARLDGEEGGLRPQVEPGPYVRLSVSDTGAGMDERVKGRLFEPFFTTKAPGKGTGLGLTTVYGIVQGAGGGILVTSQPGQGSRFDVYLPRIDGAAASSAPARAAPADGLAARGAETILLVEDEPSVRALVHELLEGAGYRVLDGGLPFEALALSSSYAGPIDLLLSDVVMPQLGGGELADRVRAGRPGLRVLFMSGYPGDAGPTIGRVLPKPVSANELLGAVREALDGPPPG